MRVGQRLGGRGHKPGAPKLDEEGRTLSWSLWKEPGPGHLDFSPVKLTAGLWSPGLGENELL